MAEQAQVLADAIRSGGVIYLSGSARGIPAGVRDALKSIAIQHFGVKDEDAANKWLEEMIETKRFVQECWF